MRASDLEGVDVDDLRRRVSLPPLNSRSAMGRARLSLLSCVLLATALLPSSSARANAPLDDDALTSLEAAAAGYVDPSFGRPAWTNEVLDEVVPQRQEEEGQRVTVRETIWVHQARPTPAFPSHKPDRPAAQEDEPANILTTLSRLKPVFQYGIEHPLKFGYAYLLPSLLSLLLFLLHTIYTLTTFLLTSLLTPLLALTHLLLTPLRTTYALLLALSPLWLSLLSALALGGILGSLAGLLTGASTRAWVDGVGEGQAAAFLRGLMREKAEGRAFGGEGRRVGAREEKGKEREMGGEEEWFGVGSEGRGMDQEEEEEETLSRGSGRTGSSRTETFGGREGQTGWRVRGAYASAGFG